MLGKGVTAKRIVKFAPGVSIDHFCDRFIFSEKNQQGAVSADLHGDGSQNIDGNHMWKDKDEQVERRFDDICA